MSTWRVAPRSLMRYSTATGRVLMTTRSTIPLRSRRRSVAVSDFCVTAGMARRSSLKRRGLSHSVSRTSRDHLSRIWSSSSRCSPEICGVWTADEVVSGMPPSVVEVPFLHQVDIGYHVPTWKDRAEPDVLIEVEADAVID